MREKISRPENVFPALVLKMKWSLSNIIFVIRFIIVDSGGLIFSVEEERAGIP